jgi:type IV secretory pathway TrbD component
MQGKGEAAKQYANQYVFSTKEFCATISQSFSTPSWIRRRFTLAIYVLQHAHVKRAAHDTQIEDVKMHLLPHPASG